MRGKIHLYVGTSDSFFLANGVHYFEAMLKTLEHPLADAEVSYGLRFEHCWNGDPSLPNYLTRLRARAEDCAQRRGSYELALLSASPDR